MSATYNRFEAGAAKSRSTRSAGRARSWVESVVTVQVRPRRLPTSPIWRIKRSTVQRATRVPVPSLLLGPDLVRAVDEQVLVVDPLDLHHFPSWGCPGSASVERWYDGGQALAVEQRVHGNADLSNGCVKLRRVHQVRAQLARDRRCRGLEVEHMHFGTEIAQELGCRRAMPAPRWRRSPACPRRRGCSFTWNSLPDLFGLDRPGQRTGFQATSKLC
jgi:hypothetical protein